ncbi:MAG: hypothetical protein IH822_01915 [Chloroflexi bacterium]|nr:hypothetical protein [Chloroflexota bacterium]
MPKVEDVLKQPRGLPRLQKAVLDYFEKHPDEVFSANDDDLEELRSKLKRGTVASLAFSIWALHRDRHVTRERVRRRYYYGSSEALKRLRRGKNGKSAS